MSRLADSREFDARVNQSSVASNLTEKIRECLRQQTSQDRSSDPQANGFSTDDDLIMDTAAIETETNENSSFLGQPPSKYFEAKFVTKGQKAREEQIIANLHAAHLREEFKRALSHGAHQKTQEEILQERR